MFDLGDTKLFEAAVLPAVLVLANSNKAGARIDPTFTSIYTTNGDEQPTEVKTFREAIEVEGVVSYRPNEKLLVKRGTLALSKKPSSVWRLASESADSWLETVLGNTYAKF